MSLNVLASAPEPLSALLPDKVGRTERLIKLGFGEDAVAADAAAKPRSEGLLVG